MARSECMRILIYGFGPYRQFNVNVTEKIVRGLPWRRGLKKLVFPVRFHKSQFTSAIEAFCPDVVLGLGQCSKGRVMRIETRAVNRRRNSADEQPRPIVRSGAPKLLTSLKLNLAGHARLSRDAGDYVCNYSMYVMMDFVERRNLPVLYGFVHVPHDYDPNKALRILRRALPSSRFNVQCSMSGLRTGGSARSRSSKSRAPGPVPGSQRRFKARLELVQRVQS
jgi:pyroglutamyl-peptidase